MEKKDEVIDGQCLCGKVNFQVSLPAKWCAHCHCTRCRKSHGSGFVTWFGVKKHQFVLTGGEKYLKWYNSSKKSRYGFCSNCGSSMLFRSSKWDDEIHITLSNVNQGIGINPQSHVYFDTHVDWLIFNDDLKRYDDPNKST